MNLASIIESHPADAVALISRGQETTYGTLREQVAAIRGGLVGLGLVPGDRLAIIAGNNWYFVASYLAALGAGLVAVPLNPQAPAPELEFELTSTGARAVVVTPAAAGAFGELDRAGLTDLEFVIALPGVELPDAVMLDDLLEVEPAPVVERSEDDLAVLMFTSGTVGSPRAAMLSHGNLLSNLEQIQSVAHRAQGPEDVVFGLLPLFHIFGLNVVLDLSLLSGSRDVADRALRPVVGHRGHRAARGHDDQRTAHHVVGAGQPARGLPFVVPLGAQRRCRERPSSRPRSSRTCGPTWASP